jgi:hypothetical protein
MEPAGAGMQTIAEKQSPSTASSAVKTVTTSPTYLIRLGNIRMTIFGAARRRDADFLRKRPRVPCEDGLNVVFCNH